MAVDKKEEIRELRKEWTKWKREKNTVDNFGRETIKECDEEV